jgi:G3E family GTPase
MTTIQHVSEDRARPGVNEAHDRPIFVIGGALGSGKTTLLRRLVAHQAAGRRRPSVIMNELVESPASGLLLPDGGNPEPGLDLRVLGSKCSCCDSRPALAALLVDTLRSSPGAIFIEASGGASTRGVAETVVSVLARDGHAGTAHLASVLAVLDAPRLAQSYLLASAHRDEVAGADTLILNRTDLIQAADLDRVITRVRSVNAEARLFTASYADIAPEKLLQVRPRPTGQTAPASVPAAATRGLVSATVELLGPVVVPRLQRLLARRRRDLVRVKGLAHTRGAPGLHELQWVPDSLEVRPWPTSARPRPELVLVGRSQLDWERLATELDECVELEPADRLREAAL